MASKTRQELHELFKSGAKPTGQNFQDLIDSALNVNDESSSTLTGSLTVNNAVSLKGSPNATGLSVDSSGNVSMGGTLSVTGNSTLTGSLTVNNAVSLKGSPSATGLSVDSSGNVSMEGTLSVTGNSTLTGSLTVNNAVSLKGSPSATGLSVDSSGNVSMGGTLNFGSRVGQHITLWQNSSGTAEYGIGMQGIGIQSGTQYFRTAKNFAWYRGGSHNDTELSPGTSGTPQMVIKDDKVGIGTVSPSQKLTVQGNATVVADPAIPNSGTLSVAGTSTLTGKVGIGGEPGTEQLKVTGGAAIAGPLSVTGTNGNLTVTGTSTLSGNTTIAGTLSATGKITANKFEGVGAVVVGMIVIWSGTEADIPQGWAFCNGQRGTPDLRNRFILGFSASNVKPLRNTGGEENVVLSAPQMPTHTHVVTVSSSGSYHKHQYGPFAEAGMSGGSHRIQYFSPGTSNYQVTPDGGDHTHPATVSSAGENSSHNNMPPYFVLAYIQCIGV